MNDYDVERYAHFLTTYDLSKIEIEHEGTRLVLERRPSPTITIGDDVATSRGTSGGEREPDLKDATTATVPKIEGCRVTAPLLGVVYRAKDQNLSPFVELGQPVSKGDVLCLIEAMKMYNEITSPVDGIIEAIHFEHGELVEYGTELFTLT